MAGAKTYRMAIRNAVRGLWKNLIDTVQFTEIMWLAVEDGLTNAWFTGAKDCGIMPSELTIEERRALNDAIIREVQWIDGFAAAIEEQRDGLLSPLFHRADIWIGRWEGVKNQASVMACSDKKYRWTLGGSEIACGSCLALSTQTRRGSFWNEKGILPRVHDAWYLSCKGYL